MRARPVMTTALIDSAAIRVSVLVVMLLYLIHRF
jgi:hypothetical protein